MISHIRRRSGEVVDFDPSRIENAIFKAAESVGGRNREESSRIAAMVTAHLAEHFSHIPHVEEVQDLVEEALIKTGHANTAKSFILYRKQRATAREEETDRLLEKMKKSEIEVTLEDGTRAPFDMKKIVEAANIAADGLEHVSVEPVVTDACRSLYPGVKTTEIEKAVINAARTRIESHPEYSHFASRLLLASTYKIVFGGSTTALTKKVPNLYEKNFSDFISKGVSYELLDERLATYFDLNALSAAIHSERDLLFEYLGSQTLIDRYLLKKPATVDAAQPVFELPQWLWMRVAMGLALSEKKKDATSPCYFFLQLS